MFQHKRTCKLDITAESVTARADLPPPFNLAFTSALLGNPFCAGDDGKHFNSFFLPEASSAPPEPPASSSGWMGPGWIRASVRGYRGFTPANFISFRVRSKHTDSVFLPVGGEEPADSRLHLEGKNEPSKDADNGGTQNSRTRVPTC